MCKTFRTERLLLRQWKDEDRAPFFSINNDSEVMRYFPRHYTRDESDAFIDSNSYRIRSEGWGAWAVEKIDSGKFIGFVGLSLPENSHPCSGDVDIGWRLAKSHWGFGYATEAAELVLEIGFESIDLQELVSFTSECNLPSINVMKKIGMTDDGVGFEHPKIEVSSRLRKHVVYRLSRSEWRATTR